MLFEKVKSALVWILLIPTTMINLLDFTNSYLKYIWCEEGKKGGKVLLTLFFVQQNLQLAFLRDYNDARSVTNIFEKLYIELRPDIFGKIFDVLLLDNGSEFSYPEALEYAINSYSKAKFGNKSPYDVFAFQYGKKILKSLGIQKISADEITLTPKLLKR